METRESLGEAGVDSNVEQLDDNCLLLVCGALNHVQDLACLSMTCKRFYILIASSEQLWSARLFSDFGVPLSGAGLVKQYAYIHTRMRPPHSAHHHHERQQSHPYAAVMQSVHTASKVHSMHGLSAAQPTGGSALPMEMVHSGGSNAEDGARAPSIGHGMMASPSSASAAQAEASCSLTAHAIAAEPAGPGSIPKALTHGSLGSAVAAESSDPFRHAILPFVGVAVDKGCDGDASQPSGYWIDHLFTPSSRGMYCSEAGKRNVHCLAVLQPTPPEECSHREFLLSRCAWPAACLLAKQALVQQRDAVATLTSQQPSSLPLPLLAADASEQARRVLQHCSTAGLEDLYLHMYNQLSSGTAWGRLLLRGLGGNDDDLQAVHHKAWQVWHNQTAPLYAISQPLPQVAPLLLAERGSAMCLAQHHMFGSLGVFDHVLIDRHVNVTCPVRVGVVYAVVAVGGCSSEQSLAAAAGLMHGPHALTGLPVVKALDGAADWAAVEQAIFEGRLPRLACRYRTHAAEWAEFERCSLPSADASEPKRVDTGAHNGASCSPFHSQGSIHLPQQQQQGVSSCGMSSSKLQATQAGTSANASTSAGYAAEKVPAGCVLLDGPIKCWVQPVVWFRFFSKAELAAETRSRQQQSAAANGGAGAGAGAAGALPGLVNGAAAAGDAEAGMDDDMLDAMQFLVGDDDLEDDDLDELDELDDEEEEEEEVGIHGIANGVDGLMGGEEEGHLGGFGDDEGDADVGGMMAVGLEDELQGNLGSYDEDDNGDAASEVVDEIANATDDMGSGSGDVVASQAQGGAVAGNGLDHLHAQHNAAAAPASTAAGVAISTSSSVALPQTFSSSGTAAGAAATGVCSSGVPHWPGPIAPLCPLSSHLGALCPEAAAAFGWGVSPGTRHCLNIPLSKVWLANMLLITLIAPEDLRPHFNTSRGGCNIDAGMIAVAGPVAMSIPRAATGTAAAARNTQRNVMPMRDVCTQTRTDVAMEEAPGAGSAAVGSRHCSSSGGVVVVNGSSGMASTAPGSSNDSVRASSSSAECGAGLPLSSNGHGLAEQPLAAQVGVQDVAAAMAGDDNGDAMHDGPGQIVLPAEVAAAVGPVHINALVPLRPNVHVNIAAVLR